MIVKAARGGGLTYHLHHPPDWSARQVDDGLELVSPEPRVVLSTASFEIPGPLAHNGADAETCASAAFAAAGGGIAPFHHEHLMSQNVDAVVLEGMHHAVRAPPSMTLVACFRTRTALDYPTIVLRATAPAAAMEAHGQAIRDIVENFRFRPAP